MNQLEQLKQFSKVVVDTGDVNLLKKYHSQDATTNPKLILDAAENEHYKAVLAQTLAQAKIDDGSDYDEAVRFAARFITEIGTEVLKVVPGRVSSELDPRLSFDTEGTIKRAQYLINLYEKKGISRERILIKIAATWEGIKAAEALEKLGIHCNLTLVFSLVQAVCCAHARVSLISPFVGRLNEYYELNQLNSHHTNPGAELVQEITQFYKSQGIATEIMAASFRNKEQVLSVAGVDLITIPPQIIDELITSNDSVSRAIHSPQEGYKAENTVFHNRHEFMKALAEDAPAYALLKDGAFKFTKAFLKLRQVAFHQTKMRLMASVMIQMFKQAAKMRV